MKLRNRTWLGLVLVIALVGVLVAAAGCGGGGTTNTTAATGDKPVQGGTLAVYIGDPSFIDPVNTFESEGTQVEQAVFDSLTSFDFLTMKLIPAVADKWEANADATVWTFHLKKGTKFHDGTIVTAKDFKYAWERICNPINKSELAYHLALVKGYEEMQAGTATELSGVKAVDDNTLEVTLIQAFGDFEYVVGHPALAPVPKAAVEKDPAAYALMPIGNGPFKMAEPWAAGQLVKVVKFADYYGTKPNVDGIDFRIFKDVETAFLEFKAGTLDWTQIPPGQYKATAAQYGIADDGYTTNPGKQVQNGGELAIYYILMNNQDPIFKNPDVRKACSLAINRQAICDTVYEGIRKPAGSIIPSGMQGYEENAWVDSHYDVEAAKAALAKAGYPNGQGLPTLKLSFNSGAGHEDVMQLVQADLKAIGINTEFDSSDAPTYWDKVGKGNYQIGRSGWIADYPIIDNFTYPLFNSESGDNYEQYKNPAVDQAINDARKITDTSERLKAYGAIVKTIGNDNPDIPIATYAHHHVASDRVHNLIYSPNGMLDFVTVWVGAAAK